MKSGESVDKEETVRHTVPKNKKRGAPSIMARAASVFHQNGGEEEIRTLDPHVANVMLYQLSYFPVW